VNKRGGKRFLLREKKERKGSHPISRSRGIGAAEGKKRRRAFRRRRGEKMRSYTAATEGESGRTEGGKKEVTFILNVGREEKAISLA